MIIARRKLTYTASASIGVVTLRPSADEGRFKAWVMNEPRREPGPGEGGAGDLCRTTKGSRMGEVCSGFTDSGLKSKERVEKEISCEGPGL